MGKESLWEPADLNVLSDLRGVKTHLSVLALSFGRESTLVPFLPLARFMQSGFFSP